MQFSFKILQNISWILLIFLIFFLLSSSAARSSEIHLICGAPKDDLSSAVSTSFVPNFVKVMESIQQQVSSRNWGHSAVIQPLPEVYALAQCHSDLSSLDCKLCFSQGRVKLPRCLPNTAARIFLDGCFLRYDNYNFLHESIDPTYDNVNCSHPTGALTDSSLHTAFKKKVAQVITNVTDRALENGTFATVEGKGGGIPVYALAQCWNSLTYWGCRACLLKAGSQLKQCAPGSQGQALFTGCYMRYSTERFFNTSSGRASRCRKIGFDFFFSVFPFNICLWLCLEA